MKNAFLLFYVGTLIGSLLCSSSSLANSQSNDVETHKPPTNVEREFQNTFRAILSLQNVTCDPSPAELGPLQDRFVALQPSLQAAIDKKRGATLLGEVMKDSRNIYTPGCPPNDELDRRVVNFEQALDRLTDALKDIS